MQIKLTEDEVKELHPDLYDRMVEKIEKKGKDPKDANWAYDYCLRIGEQYDPQTLDEALELSKERYGISLGAFVGRTRTYEGVDEFPQRFVDIVTDDFNNRMVEKQKEDQFHKNMDGILNAVGKSGSSKVVNNRQPMGTNLRDHLMNIMTQQRNQPVYPTLEDLQKVHPDVYQKYLDMANGSKLVTFVPGHGYADEWGFFIEDILVVTKRINTDVTRILTKDPHSGNQRYNYEFKDGELCSMISYLQGEDQMIEAEEGTEFNGWKRIKQYRYTQDEITEMIGSKIFEPKSELDSFFGSDNGGGGQVMSMGGGLFGISI